VVCVWIVPARATAASQKPMPEMPTSLLTSLG
jgi:hypothetical protein